MYIFALPYAFVVERKLKKLETLGFEPYQGYSFISVGFDPDGLCFRIFFGINSPRDQNDSVNHIFNFLNSDLCVIIF